MPALGEPVVTATGIHKFYGSNHVLRGVDMSVRKHETVAITDHTNATLDDDPEGSKPRQASMSGHYRNPLKLDDGSFVVSHTPEYRLNQDDSADPTKPKPR